MLNGMAAAEPNRRVESPEDLDAVVSDFLEELEVLSTELQRPAESSVSPEPVETSPTVEIAPQRLSVSMPQQHRYSWITLLSVSALALITGCWLYFRPARVETLRKEAPPAVQAEPELPPRQQPWNDAALLLAGLPLSPDSKLYSLSASAPFQRHQREMGIFWKRVRSENLSRIGRWREENIPAKLETNPVLYPLSGADYLNACAVFPHAREYLLLSLEPPGSVPDMNLLSEQETGESLSAVRETVQSLASVNYLQSRKMREVLTNSQFRGVVPVLLLLAAGFGHTIREVEPVTIGSEGQLIPATGGTVPRKFRRIAGNDVPVNAVPGIRIQFWDGAEKILKSIIYLQIQLRDEIFREAGPENRFLSRLKSRNTILKSAVYLLHGSNYARVRDFVLGASDLVVQDDSGLPYSSFSSFVWEEHLFGAYTRTEPLGTLRNPPQQPLLAKRYALGSQPLGFHYGYGVLWGAGRSNLMLFVKRLQVKG